MPGRLPVPLPVPEPCGASGRTGGSTAVSSTADAADAGSTFGTGTVWVTSSGRTTRLTAGVSIVTASSGCGSFVMSILGAEAAGRDAGAGGT